MPQEAQDSGTDASANQEPELSEDIPPKDAEPKPARVSRGDKLEGHLINEYYTIAALVSMFSVADAQVIVAHAQPRAHELVQYAVHHKQFYKFLEKLTAQSDLTVMLAGQMSMVAAIMAVHHITIPSPAEIGKRLRERQARNLARRAAEKQQQQAGQQGPSSPTEGYGEAAPGAMFLDARAMAEAREAALRRNAEQAEQAAQWQAQDSQNPNE